jgi:uncharacterized membrane protein
MATARNLARIAAAIFFSVAGSWHFFRPAPYVKIMPPFIPAALAMVYISGSAEIAGGLGLLLPPVRGMAGWGLVALLIAVFPANIYMAVDHVQVTANPLPAWLLWGRLALQPLMIWWVLWRSRPY